MYTESTRRNSGGVRRAGAAGERHVLRERHEDVRRWKVCALDVRAHRLGGVHCHRERPARQRPRRPLGLVLRGSRARALLRARLPSAFAVDVPVIVLLVLVSRHVHLVDGRAPARSDRSHLRETVSAAARQHLCHPEDAAVAKVRLASLRSPLPARYTCSMQYSTEYNSLLCRIFS